ncbi:hypothetical protein [Tumebacillus flagellatus]|uniref:Uncharacterized protein n=1 Tax=Tumebacillus flagellatus TaxID=1157490 RepID=A0A074LV11_9BACL|nr:hypothetical protein [Tumebacillus flagellatus]KEO84789.1 hypothetical protein EL26_01910 [Tumebacillus flagellatus]
MKTKCVTCRCEFEADYPYDEICNSCMDFAITQGLSFGEKGGMTYDEFTVRLTLALLRLGREKRTGGDSDADA